MNYRSQRYTEQRNIITKLGSSRLLNVNYVILLVNVTETNKYSYAPPNLAQIEQYLDIFGARRKK